MATSHSLKLLFNTIASCAKIVVNAIATLFATRYALEQLGASDYGLFNLIAGIILMLSFFSGSLSISGQRFFSIALGHRNTDELNQFFNSSLGIHLVISLLGGIMLFSIEPFLFTSWLRVPYDQIPQAKQVYEVLILSSILTIFTIPFMAMANAYEDLGILSLSDIVASIIKLTGALMLCYFADKLFIYAIFMLASVMVKAAIEFLWVKVRYTEVRIIFSAFYNKNIWREMLGFVGWNTLGSLAVVLRNQGVAVVLNLFFGVVINAAYGIANQVNSMVLSFASALTIVFTPSIVRSYGAGRITDTRNISVFSSKLSFWLSSIMALPILIFLRRVLELWLGTYPDDTYIFTIFIVLSFIFTQLYPGLNRAIYATGKIRNYSIYMSIILIAVIPIGYICFKLGLPAYFILLVLLISQFLVVLYTVKYVSKLIELNMRGYLTKSVIMPLLIFAVFLISGYLLFQKTIDLNISQILIVSLLIIASYSAIFYKLIFERTEKERLKSLVHEIIKKFR